MPAHGGRWGDGSMIAITRALLAAGLLVLGFAATAHAHPQAGGFGLGMGTAWLDPSQHEVRGLQAAAESRDASAPASSAQCRGGVAAGYPCKDVDLMSFLPLASIGGGEIGNDK